MTACFPPFGAPIITARPVDVHIGTLRTKLGTAGDILQTVRGVGYKLEAPHE